MYFYSHKSLWRRLPPSRTIQNNFCICNRQHVIEGEVKIINIEQEIIKKLRKRIKFSPFFDVYYY